MAGSASGGQTLTPNPNVTAPARNSGDQWGKFGGGATPYSGADSVAGTLARGQTANNYAPPAAPNQAIGRNVSDALLDRRTLDSSIASNGTNQG